MAEKIVVDGPRGFFALEGKELFTSAPFKITRNSIEEFCRATGNEEWQHWDEEACKAAGYKTVIAPGLYLPAHFPGVFWKHIEIQNIPNLLMPKIDEIRILRPVYAGDEFTISAKAASVKERKGKVSVIYDVTFLQVGETEPTALAKYNTRYWD